MNWIMCNMNHNFIHYNCCSFVGESIVPMHRTNVVVYDENNKMKNFLSRGIDFKKIKKKHSKIDAEMYNFEDYNINIFNKINFEHTKIIVIRDLYNMMASSLKQNIKNYGGGTFNSRLNKWIGHAHLVNNMPPNYICINYNKWFELKEYRDEIAKSLGFTNKELEVNKVPHFGKGSSFDKQKKKGSDMDVLKRYKYLPNKYIKKIEEHKKFKKIKELNKFLFNIDFEEIKKNK